MGNVRYLTKQKLKLEKF
jgi:hypothetical protein